MSPPQGENGSDIVELGSDMIEALEGSSVVVSLRVRARFYDDVPTAAVEGPTSLEAIRRS